jgi:hypothetical protein
MNADYSGFRDFPASLAAPHLAENQRNSGALRPME